MQKPGFVSTGLKIEERDKFSPYKLASSGAPPAQQESFKPVNRGDFNASASFDTSTRGIKVDRSADFSYPLKSTNPNSTMVEKGGFLKNSSMFATKTTSGKLE